MLTVDDLRILEALADGVRAAAADFNKACTAARDAGLTVTMSFETVRDEVMVASSPVVAVSTVFKTLPPVVQSARALVPSVEELERVVFGEDEAIAEGGRP